MTLAERVSAMPELYEAGNDSTACLLSKTGYLDAPSSLTVADVEQALARRPVLVDQWLERGHDQHLAGGWGIECDHGQYRVQSYANGRHLLERSKLHAVAQFIVHYVAFIGDALVRYPASNFRTAHRHLSGRGIV